jgi:hypothetical protein
MSEPTTTTMQREMQLGSLYITPSRQSVAMGGTVQIDAVLECRGDESPQDYVLLPFVNERRWGAHERPDADGKASFQLPLPNPGPAKVQVVSIKSDTDDWMSLQTQQDLLLAGKPLPNDVGLLSNTVQLTVTRRTYPPHPDTGTLFG